MWIKIRDRFGRHWHQPAIQQHHCQVEQCTERQKNKAGTLSVQIRENKQDDLAGDEGYGHPFIPWCNSQARKLENEKLGQES